jgi:hypothetical protein
MSNYSHKNDIFEKLILNLKHILKVPKELFSYPPLLEKLDSQVKLGTVPVRELS